MEGALFSCIPPNSSHTKYVDPWKLQVTHGDSKGEKPFLVSNVSLAKWRSKKDGNESTKGRKSERIKGMYNSSDQVKKNVKKTPSSPIFRPTCPPKKGFQGTGAHYGTFNSKPYDHVTENVTGCRTRAKVTQHEPRNIMTTPPKAKGPGLTPKICFDEYKYVSHGPTDPDPIEHV